MQPKRRVEVRPARPGRGPVREGIGRILSEREHHDETWLLTDSLTSQVLRLLWQGVLPVHHICSDRQWRSGCELTSRGSALTPGLSLQRLLLLLQICPTSTYCVPAASHVSPHCAL